MTWHLQQVDEARGLQRVGCWEGCDAYKGDTACSAIRPMLCFNDRGLPLPADLDLPLETYWSGGQIALTPPLQGCELTSLAAADTRCAELFGPGWRMAEFHDGWGWNFWAKGAIDTDSWFWVHISDQPANCF